METRVSSITGRSVIIYTDPYGDQRKERDVAVLSKQFQSIKSPRDTSRKPDGWLYPKPYHRDITVFSDSGSCRQRREFMAGPNRFVEFRDYSGPMGSVIGVGISTPPGGSSNERRKAEIDALLKLKNVSVDLGIAFAEANKTAKFVGGAFTSIAESLRLARRRRWKESFQRLRRSYRSRVGSNSRLPLDWLGWQYAVKPLMNDVNGAVEALRRRNDTPPWVMTVKGISVNRQQETYSHQANSVLASIREVELFRGYFVRLDYHPGASFFSALSSVGATNPLTALWEVVPWSFVIDWAVPLGDWFSTLDAAVGWDFLSGSCTERREATAVTRATAPSSLAPGVSRVGGSWTIKSRKLILNRTVYTASPVPVLPRVKNPLSIGHVANGLALLVAVAGGGRDVPIYR